MDDEQFYSFDSVGVSIGRGLIAPDVVKRANELIDRKLNGRPFAKFSFLEIDPLFFDLMEHPWIMTACQRVLGRHFRFDHAFGTEQPTASPNLHGGPQACQSSCFYHGSANSQGSAWVGRLAVGISLTGQNEESGGFIYIPGSHKSNWLKPGGQVLADILKGRFDNPLIHTPQLLPGDICVFPDCLVHGTSPRKCPGKRRVLYYAYSPGYMAWRSYAQIEKYLELAKTPLQRQLLRPPFVAEFDESDGSVCENQWRKETL